MWQILQLSPLLAEMKKQNPTNERPMFLKIRGLLRYLLEITSSELFKVNVWLTSIYPIASPKYFFLETFSFANKRNGILEESDNCNYSFEKNSNCLVNFCS